MATAQDVLQYLQSLEARIKTLEQALPRRRVACGNGRFTNPPSLGISVGFCPSQVAVYGGTVDPSISPPPGGGFGLSGAQGAEFMWVAIE